MGAHQRHRAAGLHHQRLPLFHGAQGRNDRVVGFPVARGFAECRINDEILGVFADCEDVLQQSQQTLLTPAAAA